MVDNAAENRSSTVSDTNIGFLRAARAGNVERVLDGIQHGVDINCSNANGLNALHLAAKEGFVDLVRQLINLGAKVDSSTKKGNTALHIAALGGKLEVVQLLIEHGCPINAQSQLGFTPLYMAAQENKDDVVRFLLEHGADPSLTTEEGYTPLAVALQQGSDRAVAVLLEYGQGSKVKLPALHIAAKKDDVGAAKLLLKSESPNKESMVALVNDTTKSGFTPLHIAAHYGKTNVAKLLIDMGADVNYKAKNAIAPLHVAAKWGQLAMVMLLHQREAILNIQTRDGLSPLHCAARSGYVRVVDYLLENGADHSAKTRSGLTPLHMAAQGDHVDCARLILHAKANVNDVTVDYLTALHVAAHYGHVKTAKLLLDRNCDVNARALNGFTPLHIACKKNRIKVVELLLKYGASIEATTESGLTPLHVAAFMGNMNIVLNLLQNGAAVDQRTMRGETPLHLAARANQTDVMRILLRNKADVNAKAREQQTPLHIAARMGNVDNVLLLLQHGADPEAVTKDGYTPLHIAAKEGHEEVIGVLIDQSASPNSVTKKGMTPLHIAAKYGQIGVARLLLQRGASPDKQGRNGLTALHVAAHYNQPNIVLLLLEEFRASPHCQAKNGYTPLHIAAKKNQMDIATSLLEYGARADAESKNGFTPLHLASQEGHTDMVSLLLENGANSNCYASNGLTPMHLTAQEDHVNVAEILCKYNAATDPMTKAGYTPLHTASHFGQINMVRFLLERGANVDACTRLGYTPLHQAAQQGHVLVVNLLLKNGASPDLRTNVGVTALQIARRLGYVSVDQVLQGVTQISPSAEQLQPDFKYSMVGPERMEEHSISDSEGEPDDGEVFSNQPYAFLTSDSYMPASMRDAQSGSKIGSSHFESAIEQESQVQTHQPFDDSDLYAEDGFEEQFSPLSKGSVRSYHTDRSSLHRKEDRAVDVYMPATPSYLLQRLPRVLPGDDNSEGYNELNEVEAWKVAPTDDSAPPDENEGLPKGGVFIPPKGEDSTMYDIYKTDALIRPAVNQLQETPAPQLMSVHADDAGYELTPTGQVIGPDGKVLLGPDNRPIQLNLESHSRYSLAADGTILGPNHKPVLDNEGNVVRVKPSGSKIILEPSGKLTLDAERKPLVVEAGAKLVAPGKDGRIKVNEKFVVDPVSGKPVVVRQPQVLVVVGPDLKTVNQDGKPVCVQEGSVLITPGLENYIVFANGRPVIGEDNEPVCVPAGSVLKFPNVDGTITNAAGEIVVGEDDKPLHVVDPFAALVILNPSGSLITTPSGDIVKVPAGSRLAAPAEDGFLWGPDKKKILGADGKPIKVPAGQQAVIDRHGVPVFGADSKMLLVPLQSILIEPFADGKVVKPDGKVVVNDKGEAVIINPEATCYILAPSKSLVTDRDGHFVRVSPGSQLVVPSKDGKVKGLDGKKIHGPDGKSLKAEAGKEPVVIEPGNKPLKAKDGRLMRVPAGSTIVHCDPLGRVLTADGLPVMDVKGRPLQVLPQRCKIILGPEDTPITDKVGKVITVPSGSRLTIPGQQEAILGPDGRAVKDSNGVPLGVDQGTSLMQVAPDQCIYLPDGSRLSTSEGKVFHYTPGETVAVGPDYYPVTEKDGQVLSVPSGSVVVAPRQKFVLNSEGQPVADLRGRSITVDVDSIVVLANTQGQVVLPDGSQLCDAAGRPVLVAPQQEVLVELETLKPVLDARGQPVITSPGSVLAQPGQLLYIVSPDKTVLEDYNGQPVWVMPGARLLAGDKDGYADVGTGKLLGEDNFPLRIPAGKMAVVGPDSKPLLYSDGELVFAPEGSVIMPPGDDFLRDLDGNPVKDAQGRALAVEPGTKIAEAGDDGYIYARDNTPILDREGKPVRMPPRSLLLISPLGELVQTQSGRPQTVPRGARITPVQHEYVLDDQGNAVLDPTGLPIQVTPGTKILSAAEDCYMYLPDGSRVTDINGVQVMLPPGSTALVGPDGKAQVDANGDVILVPDNSQIKRSHAPQIQKAKKPVIDEILAQEKAITAEAAVGQQMSPAGSLPRSGRVETPTSPPPLPSTLPPGSLPWSLFTLRKEKTIDASYSGPTFGNEFNPDNVVVDRSPVFTGFLVSFMVDARGGAMRGCRHAGVRIIIPPGMATCPTRVTCRMLKKEKMTQQPPLNDGEALASRVVSLGPVGTDFLGPVIIEIPHFASLRGNEREITVLRSDDGKKWTEHDLYPSDDLVFKAVNDSFDDIEPLDELEKKRITRIVTTSFPKYFALVSRVRVETKMLGQAGGIINSTVIPQAQAIFPEGALKKQIKVGLQAQPVPADLVAKMFGNRAAVSPIVTLEPRRRRFHRSIILTFPLPKAASRGMTNQYAAGGSPSLRLLCSMADETKPADWQDITTNKELSFVNDCVSFATDISARFWLVDYQTQTPGEVIGMANNLYKELCAVPFMSRFVVFAKRHEQREARLRVFCMTDDRIDKTLEAQELFTEVARSRDIEVLEDKPQWVEMAGNLVPITRTSDTQLHLNFHAFQENRLPFIVRIRDPDQDPNGRVAFMREPKVPKGDPPQNPMCNLHITLPEYNEDLRTASDFDLSKASDFNERYRFYRDHGITMITENIVSTGLHLPEIANELSCDWPALANELQISNKEVDRIQSEYETPEQQALAMLQYWLRSAGTQATGNALEKALLCINRPDVISKCIHSVKPVTAEKEKVIARKQLGIAREKDAIVVSKNTEKSEKISPDEGEEHSEDHLEKLIAQHREILDGNKTSAVSSQEPDREIIPDKDSRRPASQPPTGDDLEVASAKRRDAYLNFIAELDAVGTGLVMSESIPEGDREAEEQPIGPSRRQHASIFGTTPAPGSTALSDATADAEVNEYADDDYDLLEELVEQHRSTLHEVPQPTDPEVEEDEIDASRRQRVSLFDATPTICTDAMSDDLSYEEERWSEGEVDLSQFEAQDVYRSGPYSDQFQEEEADDEETDEGEGADDDDREEVLTPVNAAEVNLSEDKVSGTDAQFSDNEEQEQAISPQEGFASAQDNTTDQKTPVDMTPTDEQQILSREVTLKESLQTEQIPEEDAKEELPKSEPSLANQWLGQEDLANEEPGCEDLMPAHEPLYEEVQGHERYTGDDTLRERLVDTESHDLLMVGEGEGGTEAFVHAQEEIQVMAEEGTRTPPSTPTQSDRQMPEGAELSREITSRLYVGSGGDSEGEEGDSWSIPASRVDNGHTDTAAGHLSQSPGEIPENAAHESGPSDLPTERMGYNYDLDAADYNDSSEDSDLDLHRSRQLNTIDEMPDTVALKKDPPIDITYESGLNMISSDDSNPVVDTSGTLGDRAQSDDDDLRRSIAVPMERPRHHSSPDSVSTDNPGESDKADGQFGTTR